MDSTTPALPDRCQLTSNVNGSAKRPSPVPCTSPGAGARPTTLMDPSQTHQLHGVQVVVNRDERGGYGMKVSGDNPVYVQSVKEGGAAERAGLHAGDKIIKVNGVVVIHSTHMHVVGLIRASSPVVLTVQQTRIMNSPSLHNRPISTPTNARITGPQPVDNEKQHQLQLEKEQYYKLMIEKEQNYIDLLRSQIASSPDEKKCSELAKIEKNLKMLQTMLHRSQSEQSPPLDNPSTSSHHTFPLSPARAHRSSTTLPSSPNGNSEPPPPLPKRNQPRNTTVNNTKRVSYVNGKAPLLDINAQFLNNEINANHNALVVDSSNTPPPLPPRNSQSAPLDSDAVNSINKQMSYPLVATCATLVDNYSPNQTHHRTKSSPETLLRLSGADASKKLIASESMNDLNRQEGWENPATPPGTPPPPYPSPNPVRRDRNSNNTDESDMNFTEHAVDGSSPEVSPIRVPHVLANSSPIHAANPQISQQPIISMEDDEISDQEISQLEDHGHFKSLSRLWEHLPHLAVFTNYILSNFNKDPNSLLFYLLTDLYKEGNAKEMRKWAFEIHSCFLVPGAPLRLNNVDENIAREIDDVLTKEFDKEEILRKIFWKARSRAKEELTRQLTDFQQKRTAGLGTIFGPTDQALEEVYHDRTKEMKLYESLFMEKWDPYLDEVEKESYDPKIYYTAAALTTVFTRVFLIRSNSNSHALDRCPTFVSKEKSFKTKLIGRNPRKLNILGHQFVAQQYYTVIPCNNCHQIIYGIGPQGYQCSACLINLHRTCVKLYDDTCPGPIIKKDRGIGKFMRIRHESSDHKRKQTQQLIQMEKRHTEERDGSFDHNESGEVKSGQPVSRSGSDRRPDAVREESFRQESGGKADNSYDFNHDKDDNSTSESAAAAPTSGNRRRTTTNLNRSESAKGQSEKKNKRRHTSDPLHTKSSGGVELEQQPGLSNTDSGSSSNSSISCNGRLSESPSNSVDAVAQGLVRGKSDSDSDIDGEGNKDWQELVTEEELKNLNPQEKKRQDVINEFFQTESSHVRNLKVLYNIFYKKLLDSQTVKTEELSLIFPNIKEMLDIHTEFNKEMMRRRKKDPIVKEVGDMLVQMFEGEKMQRAAATFCERQQSALEFIKERRKRDSKFDLLLAECEKRRQCRRLQLQGIIPTEMQRLSKYPLLLGRLIQSVEADATSEQSQDEIMKLRKAHQMSKEILNYVNEAAKLAMNKVRLEDIQRHLDTSSFDRLDHAIVGEFRPLDLTRFNLLIEGGMQLHRPNKAIVPVHILLLEEAVIILHLEGDRFFLKFFQSGNTAQPQPLSPIIKINTLLVRRNAVSKNALFLVNTSTTNSQMYNLYAEDESKRDTWLKHFTDASDTYNKREGKTKRHDQSSSDFDDAESSESVQDLRVRANQSEKADTTIVDDPPSSANSKSEPEEPVATESSDQEQEQEREVTASPEMVAGGGVQRVSAEDWPLIQPSQVNIAIPPVHTAESMLTPIEQIKRKDAVVKQALAEKERLVGDLLNIPSEEFPTIVDMISHDPSRRNPSELVLSAIVQVHQLNLAVNQSLNISDADAVATKGGKHASCASQVPIEPQSVPSVSAHVVQEVAQCLSTQLTTLLSELKQIEDERDRLRRELHNVRERLHEEHHLHDPIRIENPDDSTPTESSNQDSAPQEVSSKNEGELVSEQD